MLLALIGGAAGCALALGVTTTALKGLASDAIVPRLDEVAIDLRVLSFATLVSVLTGLLFGLVPALHASRPNMNEALKDAGRTGIGRRRTPTPARRAGRRRGRALGRAAHRRRLARCEACGRCRGVNPGFDPRRIC